MKLRAVDWAWRVRDRLTGQRYYFNTRSEALAFVDDVSTSEITGEPLARWRDRLIVEKMFPSQESSRDPTAWQSEARRYLERLGKAEWEAQGRPVPNPKTSGVRGARRGKFVPSPYHRELIELLNANDEEGFKGLKMREGYASVLGV